MPYRAMEVPRLPACQQRLCSAGSSGRGKPLCGTAPLDLVPRTTLALLSLTLPTWSVAHMHPAHRDTRLLPCRALLHRACQGLAAGLLCPNTQVSRGDVSMFNSSSSSSKSQGMLLVGFCLACPSASESSVNFPPTL